MMMQWKVKSMIKVDKDLLVAFLLGFIAYLIILIITGNHNFSQTVWLVTTNFHILSTRIFKLEQKLKKMERLFGWNLDKE